MGKGKGKNGMRGGERRQGEEEENQRAGYNAFKPGVLGSHRRKEEGVFNFSPSYFPMTTSGPLDDNPLPFL